MNKKLVLTGKAVLSTVMASTMACSMLSTNILAQEPEVVPEEETTVEKTPVEEETTATEEATEVVEEPTETPEEATGGNEETTLNDTTTVNEIADSPVVLAESSLKQSTSYPKPEYEQYTVEELKSMLSEKINEVKNLWETNGGYDYYKNNQSIKTVLNYLTKAEEYLAEGNSTAMTFSWRVYEMTNAVKTLTSNANILTEIDKKIYELNKEKESLNEADYTAESWKAYADKLSEAMTKVNGSGTPEEKKQQYYDEIVALKNALVKVDQNLVKLKDLVLECEEIANNQKTENAINYDGNTWRDFITKLNAAREEINKGETTIDEDTFNKLYNELVTAKNALVPVEGNTEGKETGTSEFWQKSGFTSKYSYYGGQVYVAGEKTNGDGTTTLYINWVNNGINALTGGMFTNSSGQSRWPKGESYRPFEQRDIERYDRDGTFGIFAMVNKNVSGEHIANNVRRLRDLTDEELLNGFTGLAVTVNTGDQVIIGIGMNPGKWIGTFSSGIYQTKTPDTTAPEVKVSYSTVDKTESPVTVTITADEPIQDIPGWTRVSENVLKKDYTVNTNESIDVLDLAGNVTTVSVTVSNIVKPSDPSGTGGDKNQGTETKKEESKKTDGTNTGVFVGTGLFAGSATAAAAGAGLLAFLKKRKK